MSIVGVEESRPLLFMVLFVVAPKQLGVENAMRDVKPDVVAEDVGSELEDHCCVFVKECLLPPGGFEPPTSCLQGICSTTGAKEAFKVRSALQTVHSLAGCYY